VFSGSALSVTFELAPLGRDSPGATGGTTPPRSLGVHSSPRAAQVKSRARAVAGQVGDVVIAHRSGTVAAAAGLRGVEITSNPRAGDLPVRNFRVAR
jgi:hypothetical protein